MVGGGGMRLPFALCLHADSRLGAACAQPQQAVWACLTGFSCVSFAFCGSVLLGAVVLNAVVVGDCCGRLPLGCVEL